MAYERVVAANDDTFPVSDTWRHDGQDTVFQYVNGLDVTATFTLYGTHTGDTAFDDEVQLASTDVSTDSTDRDALSEEWDLLKIEINATSPTSGSATAYQHEETRS